MYIFDVLYIVLGMRLELCISIHEKKTAVLSQIWLAEWFDIPDPCAEVKGV